MASAQSVIKIGMDTAAIAQGFGKIRSESKKTAKGIESDMGAAGRAGAVAFGAMTATLGAALGVASRLAQTVEESGDRVLAQTEAMGALLSLAPGQAGRTRLIQDQSRLQTEFGLSSAVALRTAHQLQSQSVSGSLLTQAGQIGAITEGGDPAAFVQGAGRFFRAQGITDPKRQSRLADLLFEAGLASEAGAPQIASAAALVAPAVAGTGISDEDIITTLGAVGGKTPKEFATDLRTLLGSFTRLGLEKGTLLEGVEGFSQRFGTSGGRALKAAGGTNALAALNLIQQQVASIEDLETRAGEVGIGGRFEEIQGQAEFGLPFRTKQLEATARVAEERRSFTAEQIRRQVVARERAKGGAAGLQAEVFTYFDRLLGITERSAEVKAFDERRSQEALGSPESVDSDLVKAIQKGPVRPATFNDDNQGGPNAGINTATGPGL